METVAELRAEAQRLQAFALSVEDPEVLTELRRLIEELDR